VNTKNIEKEGSKVLKDYLYVQGFRITTDCREYGCDLIASKDGRKYYIELKACAGASPTNLRFTHQTISKMGKELKNLIVAHVYNLSSEKPSIRFFKISSSVHLFVEPHFIIQPNKQQNLLYDDIDSAINSDVNITHWQKIEKTIENTIKIRDESYQV
jgi:hypothetical protein